MPKGLTRTPYTIGNTAPLLPSRYNASSGLVLWRWNQTDLSQFDSLIHYGTGNGSVAFATDFPGNVTGLPCIKFTGTTAGTVARAVLPIKSTEIEMPEKFWIYVVVDEQANSGAGMVYAYQDTTHWCGMSIAIGSPAVVHTIANNAAPVDSPADFGTNTTSKFGAGGEQWRDARCTVQIEYPAAGAPGLSVAWQSPFELYAVTSNGRASASGTWAAGWDASTARRPALHFFYTSNNDVARIRSAVILAHPNDL